MKCHHNYMAEGFAGEHQTGERLTLDHRLLFSTAILFFFSFCLITPSYGAVALSGMTGISLGNNVTADVEGNKVTFTQTSQTAVVDHEILNLREHEHLEHQYRVENSPVTNERYVILHRVTGGESSTLNGRISAIGKGEVWFSNPSGIVFGKNAQVVNVAGLLATTGEIHADHFKRNVEKNSSLEWNVRSSEPITIEKGAQIEVNDNGYALLAGQQIHNHGAITGRFSKVELGSGTTFVLQIDEDSTIGFQIKTGGANSELVHNGEIRSPGGTIHLGSKTTKGTVGEVMRIEGLIQADTIEEQTGEIEIILQGSTSAKMNLNGVIEAVGKKEKERGGKIKISGGSIDKGNSVVMNASGQNGGGIISIGKGTETSFVTTEKGAKLRANGFIIDKNGKKGVGDGGKIFLHSAKELDAYGEIEASAGQGGYTGYVDLKTENGVLSYAGNITVNGEVNSDYTTLEMGNIKFLGRYLTYSGTIYGNSSNVPAQAILIGSKSLSIDKGAFHLSSQKNKSNSGRVILDSPSINIKSIEKHNNLILELAREKGKVRANSFYLSQQGIMLDGSSKKNIEFTETDPPHDWSYDDRYFWKKKRYYLGLPITIAIATGGYVYINSHIGSQINRQIDNTFTPRSSRLVKRRFKKGSRGKKLRFPEKPKRKNDFFSSTKRFDDSNDSDDDSSRPRKPRGGGACLSTRTKRSKRTIVATTIIRNETHETIVEETTRGEGPTTQLAIVQPQRPILHRNLRNSIAGIPPPSYLQDFLRRATTTTRQHTTTRIPSGFLLPYMIPHAIPRRIPRREETRPPIRLPVRERREETRPPIIRPPVIERREGGIMNFAREHPIVTAVGGVVTGILCTYIIRCAFRGETNSSGTNPNPNPNPNPTPRITNRNLNIFGFISMGDGSVLH